MLSGATFAKYKNVFRSHEGNLVLIECSSRKAKKEKKKDWLKLGKIENMSIMKRPDMNEFPIY